MTSSRARQLRDDAAADLRAARISAAPAAWLEALQGRWDALDKLVRQADAREVAESKAKQRALTHGPLTAALDAAESEGRP